MTMKIQPRSMTGLYDTASEYSEEVIWMPTEDGGLTVQCEVTGPKSLAGRQCVLIVPQRQVVALLKAAKEAAIEVRTEGMQS